MNMTKAKGWLSDSRNFIIHNDDGVSCYQRKNESGRKAYQLEFAGEL